MTQFNILLVEDNEGDVMIAQHALDGWRDDCALAVVHNGEIALKYLHRHGEFENAARPDLILLDINMPGMDGKECLKILKQEEKLSVIPVVMLSSSDLHSDMIYCFINQASCYVVKPFGVRAYIDAVRSVTTFWADVAQRPSGIVC